MAYIDCPCGHRLKNVREEEWQMHLIPVTRLDEMSRSNDPSWAIDNSRSVWECPGCKRLWVADSPEAGPGAWYSRDKSN